MTKKLEPYQKQFNRVQRAIRRLVAEYEAMDEFVTEGSFGCMGAVEGLLDEEVDLQQALYEEYGYPDDEGDTDED